MKQRLAALSHLLLLPLTFSGGCDSIHGLNRKARVSFVPEPAKVVAVIRATPGVDTVEYRAPESRYPWETHSFSYHGGSNVGATLAFTTDVDRQRVELRHYIYRMHRPPPREWIDATRPVMIQIEAALEKSCSLTNLQASIVEKWIGMSRK